MTPATRDTDAPAELPDIDDFPNAPQGWSPESCQRVAESESLDLVDEHWLLIQALQEYFVRHDRRVNVRELQDALHEKFHHVGGRRRLFQILPGGPVAQGCRLAGLERPPGSIDVSFGSVY